MCGIVGAVARRNVTRILLEGLLRLEYRGYDSAGVAVFAHTSGELRRFRRVGKVRELVDAVTASDLTGTTGIAHTRWATHGKPTEENAHPHMSGNRVAVVHNGIIENHKELREELEAAGYEFLSDTDTEVICHLVDQKVAARGDLLEGFREAIALLEGAFAVGVLHCDYPNQLVGARLGSPLIVGCGIEENFIASDAHALRAVTDRFIYLEEGEIVELSADEISIYGIRNDSVESRVVKLDHGVDAVDKGGHRHYMLKEIYEQPGAVADTLAERVSNRRVLAGAFGVDADGIFARTRAVQIVACGSSYYTAMIARYWIEELARLPCSVEIASEFRYRDAAVIDQTLFITVSQSGETADTLAALADARESGYLATLAICNVPGSSIVRDSDLSLMIHAGPEICVASTKAFTTQLADLLLVALILGAKNGLPDEKQVEITRQLRDLPAHLTDTLKLDRLIGEIAVDFVDKEHALFLGRGTQYPVALEGALKLKEISYIHAEGYPAGELKHGPLALVDEDMPVVAVAPSDELLEKIKSNLQEVRARGGRLYVFTDEEAGFIEEEDCVVVRVPHTHAIVSPIIYTVPLQLLAYHVAVLKGTDVDQPRNLAKSVTVE